MSLVVAWLAFPLLLCLLSLGCGLVVERLTAMRLPGMLLLPLGFYQPAELKRLRRLVPG